MVKRTIFLFVLVALLASNNDIFARSRLAIRDDVPPVDVRSIKRIILADNTVDFIQLLFRYNYGEVNVVVTDDAGSVVYQETAAIASGSELFIATADWSLGSYTLNVITAAGNLAGSWSFDLVED